MEEDFLDNLPPEQEYLVQEYLKVGLYCNWSWEEFENTPPWVRAYISRDIDQRLSSYAAKSGVEIEPGPMPLNYFHLALLLALAAMFSGDD